MIPTTEWKFLEGTEQRIKHLARHRQENLEALARGTAPAWDPATLAQRQATILQEMDYPERVETALASDPSPEEARHLELHRRWVLRALFETHPDIHPLLHHLQEEAFAFIPTLGGKPLTAGERRHLLLYEPDRDMREKAYKAYLPLWDNRKEEMTELIRRRELLARSLVEAGFPHLAFHFYEQDRSQTVGWLDEFERFTRKAFQEAKAEVAKELNVEEVEAWDLVYGINKLSTISAEPIPTDAIRQAVLGQCRRWGFETTAQKLFVVDHDSPLGTTALAVEIPEHVHVLDSGTQGYEGLRDIFRAYGRALHHANVESKRHFLEQESPAMVEASARIFETVLRERAWLDKHLKATDAEVEAHDRARRWMRLAELRRLAARTAFENLVYAQSDIDPQRLYGDVNEQMLMQTRNPDLPWSSHLTLATQPLESFSGLLGEMIAAQTWSKLKQTFPDAWESAEVGDWLRRHYFAPGARIHWQEKVEQATGKELAFADLVADLGVEYDGPSLEESVSDKTAEDYFRGIDLGENP